MSTGNPYGLSEISHYGSMRNVGGKAGGFINKKFFHPSSLRNQEKLWKAITSDAAEKRKQDDLEKAREEERKVDALRKEMYLAGQSKSAMFTAASSSEGKERGTLEQIKANRELKRRKELLKEAKEAKDEAKEAKDEEIEILEEYLASPDPNVKLEEDAGEGTANSAGSAASSRTLVKSKYPEDWAGLWPQKFGAAGILGEYFQDITVRGHSQIWGSWFTTDEQRWGFGCCHITDLLARCPHGPEEEEPPLEKPAKKKRRRNEKAEAASPAEPSQGSV
ncbi:unnamed protein product [Cladocopium goreaui]|uniref:Pre-mRNA-splicing factor SLU7 n=1 Tax=Cladocopium goreaui TaxID=2562237 RepID=A0A9P1CPS6_9DINO|nr:unnamed protein product [Cladocopium goreaui]